MSVRHMFSPGIGLSAALAVLIPLAATGADKGVAPDDAIARAVKELGDKDFRVREKASAFLWSAGEAAEPALQEALKSADPEVVRRAQAILQRLNWGIYPDTPKETLVLIQQFKESWPSPGNC